MAETVSVVIPVLSPVGFVFVSSILIVVPEFFTRDTVMLEKCPSTTISLLVTIGILRRKSFVRLNDVDARLRKVVVFLVLSVLKPVLDILALKSVIFESITYL